MKFVCGGRLRSGAVHVSNRRRMDEILRGWKDCNVILTIERAHATRSEAQNAYLWAVINERVADHFSKTTGRRVSPVDAHELLKAQFLPHRLAQEGRNGTLMNGLVIGGTTTTLNKLEFIEYIETVVGWAAEKWNLYLPDPNPDWRAEAEEEKRKAEHAA